MKICIVSSYSNLCGNASYTRALQEEFIRQGHECDIFDLKHEFFISKEPIARKVADNMTEKFCKNFKNYDYVNFQMEFGLYGGCFKDIQRRLLKMIAACKGVKLSVTLHRVKYEGQKKKENNKSLQKKMFE